MAFSHCCVRRSLVWLYRASDGHPKSRIGILRKQESSLVVEEHDSYGWKEKEVIADLTPDAGYVRRDRHLKGPLLVRCTLLMNIGPRAEFHTCPCGSPPILAADVLQQQRKH